ncbi:MAG: Crp/Fnr family transcriptional regulator [Chloroflexota bacterium]
MQELSVKKHSWPSNINLFMDLSPEELVELNQQLTLATCKAGKIFYMPNDSGELLYLLMKGFVKLYHISSNGKKIIVSTCGPGSFFGEMSLVGQGIHSTFAEAVNECVFCVMSRVDVERLIREKPSVAFRFVQALGHRLKDIESRLGEIAFKSIPYRLASLLIELDKQQGSKGFVKGYTHEDFSEMLGTNRETVSQILKDFKTDGLVDTGRKRVKVLNYAKLKSMATE